MVKSLKEIGELWRDLDLDTKLKIIECGYPDLSPKNLINTQRTFGTRSWREIPIRHRKNIRIGFARCGFT